MDLPIRPKPNSGDKPRIRLSVDAIAPGDEFAYGVREGSTTFWHMSIGPAYRYAVAVQNNAPRIFVGYMTDEPSTAASEAAA